MSYKDDYYSEGDYKCNHPESDFENNSEGPIQLKREGFVEYTHRNEISNQRYDVWNRSNSSSYSNTSRPNTYSTRNTSKTSIVPALIVIAIIFLPVILSILSTIFEIIDRFI